jgi:hypothetical protein
MYVSFWFIGFGLAASFVAGIFLGSVSVDVPEHVNDHTACDARYKRMCQKYRIEIDKLETEIRMLLEGTS